MKKSVCQECQKKLMKDGESYTVEQFDSQWEKDNIVICPDGAIKSGAVVFKCKDQRITAFEMRLSDLDPEAVTWCPYKAEHKVA